MRAANDIEHGADMAWNFYIDGTIAFLEKDAHSLQQARDALAKIKPSDEEVALVQEMMRENPHYNYPEGHEFEPQNLSFLDGFIKCFDAPFAKAYGGNC